MDDKQSKIVKGPTMPPDYFDLDKLAKSSQASISNNWMGLSEGNDDDVFSSFGKAFKKPKDDEKKIVAEQISIIQSERELNPYWKSGGTGLPENDSKSFKSDSKKSSIGDGGLNWWTKALDRCHEFAKSEGKSVEEVAAERYGSLEALMKKINEAGGGATLNTTGSKFMKPGESSFDRNRRNDDQYSKSNWRKKDAASEYRRKKDYEEEIKKKKHRSSSSSSSSDSSYKEKKNKHKKRDKKKNKKKESKRKRHSSSSSSTSSTTEFEEIKHDDVEMKQADNNKFEEPPEPKRIDADEGLDLNELGAKLVKAELMEDETMIQKLKGLMEIARKRAENNKQPNVRSEKNKEQTVIIASKTDRFGNEMPLRKAEFDNKTNEVATKKSKKMNNYTKDGKFEKHFADDDKYSLKDLVEKEKRITSEDNNLMYSTMKSKTLKTTSEDFDDDFIGKCANKQLDGWSRIKVLAEQRTKSEKLGNCEFCFENYKKHLIVSIGSLSYLALPSTKSFVEGHCLIIPMQHYISSLMVDEDVWAEMNLFRKALVEMFNSQNLDCVFIEQFINEKDFEHMCIECIPLNREAASLAPMYFKKAISEAESEWAQNKQMIYLKGKGIRRSVPKGLPYFSVEFGLDEGIAHVIENKAVFPKYFAKEIIGGLMDLESNTWRRSAKEEFSSQRNKVLTFSKNWKLYDFTKK